MLDAAIHDVGAPDLPIVDGSTADGSSDASPTRDDRPADVSAPTDQLSHDDGGAPLADSAADRRVMDDVVGDGPPDAGVDAVVLMDASASDASGDSLDGGDARSAVCGEADGSVCAPGMICVMHGVAGQIASSECVADPCAPQAVNCSCARVVCRASEVCLPAGPAGVTCQLGR